MVTETEKSVQGPSPSARKVVAFLDKISDVVGKFAAVLILPMMYVLGHEVISRYYFNAPTIWAGDLALIMYGIYFMIGSPYCLKEGMHIRTDFLYHRWSTKTKGLVDTIIYVFLYIPTHIIFLEVGWKYFFKSFKQNEVIISSPWMPIIWPMKLAIPVGIVLMLMQGFSETIKSYYAWRYGEFFWGEPGESQDDAAKICEPQIQ
jgi:TRAP-type mannitol/chloroaromatic compound transport system permease small subunit